MNRFLALFVDKLMRHGDLEVETCDGAKRRFGDGAGPKIAIRIADRAAERELLLNPELALGELYMDGRLELVEGDLYDFVALAAGNLIVFSQSRWMKLLEKARAQLNRFQRRNNRKRAKTNVERHYDHDRRLYSFFLDADQQYSCAYFEHEGQSLEDAQLAKKRHLAAKLLIEEGQSVLDIGSGFGGMALYLAQIVGARALGVTLSEEQFAISSRRAVESGLGDRVAFRKQDYRDVGEQFDRIVSVGMFEHVGLNAYDEFFATVRRQLKDDGVMVLHSIGRSEGPSSTNPWIRKYIFPGGYIPSVSETMAAIERSGLYVTDIEILRLHYADTLKEWRRRFLAHRDEVKAIYDERFCRMWEFYLVGSEIAFRVYGHMVFHIQLAKRQDVVPRTRDYIGEREAKLRKREGQKNPAALRAAS